MLGLDVPPRRLESYDISNTGSSDIVASMVVYTDGRPAKGDWRRFKLRDLDGPDDYASMEQVLRRRRKDIKEKESREAQVTLQNFGDRINPQSASLPGIAKAEESVLGLLLLFEEYRNEVSHGKIPLADTDFVTDFHRRIFQKMMEMHDSESGFHFELMGEDFSPDELGRMQRMMVTRQELSQNGPDAFRLAVQSLREKCAQEQAKQGDLNDRIAFLRQKNMRKRENT
jgi:hypothetical protein